MRQIGASPSTAVKSSARGEDAKQSAVSQAIGHTATSAACVTETIVITDNDDPPTLSQKLQREAAQRTDNQIAAQEALQAILIANTARTQVALKHKGFGSEYAALVGVLLSHKHACMATL